MVQAWKAPATITVHRLDASGGEVTVDGTAGYADLERWQRMVTWNVDRLSVADEVALPKGKSGTLMFRWHLGTQEEVRLEGQGTRITVGWAEAEMTLESSLPIVVTSELLPDNTVTLGNKVGPDHLHRCVVVRTEGPCRDWTLKTEVRAK